MESVSVGAVAYIALIWLCGAVFTAVVAAAAFKAGFAAARGSSIAQLVAAQQKVQTPDDILAEIRRRVMRTRGILPPSGYTPVTREMQREVSRVGGSADDEDLEP